MLLKGLVKRVTKALKETGGASTDYQLVVIELKGLKSMLRHLEALEPNEDNVIHINAIRGIALACQLRYETLWSSLKNTSLHWAHLRTRDRFERW